MDPIQIVVLALVQGITEFLPISSSGHLVLTPVLFGWPDQGLTMDIAVHVGTLFAVMLYFRRDMFAMARGVVALGRGMWTAEAKLLCLVAVGTVPVVAVGAAVAHYGLTDGLRNAEAIGWSTLGFGILLWLSDRLGMTLRRVEHMGIPGAALIGCAQVLALIPGASRSGVTMTAARFLGYERAEAARFSMLLSIPVILAAGTLLGLDVAAAAPPTPDMPARGITVDIVLAAGLAFAAALLAIAVMMSWIRRAALTPFVIYRMVLGLGLLGWVYL